RGRCKDAARSGVYRGKASASCEGTGARRWRRVKRGGSPNSPHGGRGLMDDQESIAAEAIGTYEAIAERFAEHSETSAHNAFCERPATLSLLPDVRGMRVLDAGCGPGFYTEWLARHGADVVGIDGSAKMVALTRKRVGPSAAVRQWNLLRPLDFL